MVDGTGMCGGCRVLVNNSSQFACVDGPEFDATQVNFEVLTQRNNMYREQEKRQASIGCRPTRKASWKSFAARIIRTNARLQVVGVSNE